MNQQKMRFPIGAILLLVITGSNVLTLISNIVATQGRMDGFFFLVSVLEIMAFAFLAISLMIRQKVLITIAAGFATLVELIATVPGVVSLFTVPSQYLGTQFIAALHGFLWVLVMALLAVMSLDKIPALRKLFFLPAVLVLLSKVLMAIQPLLYIGLYGMEAAVAIGQAVGTVIGSVLPAATFFLVGQWLANPYVKQPAPRPGYAPVQPGYPQQPQYQAPQYQQPGYQGSYGQQPYQAPQYQQPPYQAPQEPGYQGSYGQNNNQYPNQGQ